MTGASGCAAGPRERTVPGEIRARVGWLGAAGAALAACATTFAAPPADPPDALARATQLVRVVTPGWDSATGELQRFVRDDVGSPWRPVGEPVPVVVGRAGLAWGVGFDSLAATIPARVGPSKREGDGRAPAGAFPLDRAFGFAAADSMRGVAFPYLPLSPGTECVDDVESARYNRVLDRGAVTDVDWRSAERMREISQYRLGVIVDYNPVPVPGRGSCIFLHVWAGPASPTVGCTAMEHDALAELVAWLDPRSRPVLVQLPAAVDRALRDGWGLPERTSR